MTFSKLRKVMKRYGSAGGEEVQRKMAKWSERLKSFGEVSGGF